MQKKILRPYQLNAIAALRNAGAGRHLTVMATGSGKTLTLAAFLRLYHTDDRVIWIAHRKELLAQAEKAFAEDIYTDENTNILSHTNIVHVTVQTLVRRYKEWARPKILVIDEAHHSAAPTYREIIEYYKPEYLLGLTATPNRGDGVRLDDIFDNIVFEYDLLQAINESCLSPVHIRQIRTKANLAGVRTQLGDFAIADLRREIDIDSRNNLVVQTVKESPRPAMVFAVDVEHAKRLAELMQQNGLNAVAVDGEDRERDEKFLAFQQGKHEVLVNCELYTEGADIPQLRSVHLARPTKSVLLYIQMAGRVMRTAEGKTAGLLVDYVDNSGTHSLCQSPVLIGLDPPHRDCGYTKLLDGDLTVDIPKQVHDAYRTFDAIVKSDVIIKDWAKLARIDTHNIAFTRLPSGDLVLSLPREGKGNIYWRIPKISLVDKQQTQTRIDELYATLCREYSNIPQLWNITKMRYLRTHAAATKQIEILIRLGHKDWVKPNLTKYDASKCISALLGMLKK